MCDQNRKTNGFIFVAQLVAGHAQKGMFVAQSQRGRACDGTRVRPTEIFHENLSSRYITVLLTTTMQETL